MTTEHRSDLWWLLLTLGIVVLWVVAVWVAFTAWPVLVVAIGLTLTVTVAASVAWAALLARGPAPDKEATTDDTD